MTDGGITAAATFEALEGAIAGDLAGMPAGRARPVWVLVPNNLVALHLRRAVAARLGGVAGVGFLTLKDAARRTALLSLTGAGSRPLPPGAEELVLRRLLDGVPDGSYFAGFRRFANAAPAILQAVRTLAACRWTPDALAEAAPATGRRDPDAPRRLRELAELWARFRQWRRQRGLFTDDDLIRAAAGEDTEPAERPGALLIYGFYDLNPSQRALVARLAGRAEVCRAYLLWQPDDDGAATGFEYAMPTLSWLKEQLGVTHVDCADPEPQDTDLDRLRRLAFRERPSVPDREAGERLRQDPWPSDGSVRVINCPGQVAEAQEVVREALRAGSDGGGSVGVLLRAADGTVTLLEEAFDRAGLPYYVREGLPLSDTPAGRIVMGLLDIAAGDAERAAVMDFLSVAQLDWPSGLAATALDRVSREAGVTRSSAVWQDRLHDRAEELRGKADRADDETGRPGLVADAQLCDLAVGFLREFFAMVAPLAEGASWRETVRHLHDLAERFSPSDDPATAATLDAVRAMEAMDAAETEPTVESVRWMLGRRLAGQSLKRERFQHVGPTVAGIMSARGATFDVVVVAGLHEKGFPRPTSTSSMLTEPDREALNDEAERQGCGRLPVQADRPLEERYLFRIALASARRGIVLTYARMEQDSGRPRVASRFMTEACSALVGFGVGAGLVDEGLPEGLVDRIPLSRRGPSGADRPLALDAAEYDGAVFADDLRAGVAYMSAVSESFRRSTALDEGRWRRDRFGPYDGKVRAGDLMERLAERYGRFGTPISPSRLETYARCPFEYFLSYILKIQEVEAPSDELELPPLERGILVHGLLRETYEVALTGRPLADLDEGAVLAMAGEAIDRLGRLTAQTRPAAWTAQREKLMEQVAALLEHERREHAVATPRAFEYAFGVDDAAGFEFVVDEETSMLFRGRIDRIDDLPGGELQIVDYKTGRPDRYKPNRLAGGMQLQLPIYLLAATSLLDARGGRALYLMLGGPKDVQEFDTATLRERMDDFRKALRLIVRGIAGGDFFPLPADSSDARNYCERYCRYRNTCGAARRSLAEIKQDDPDARRLRALRAIE